MCIKWQDHFSVEFSIENGVKQGVLSPTKFSKYMHNLLEEYEEKSLDGDIGSVFCGAF